MVVIVVVFVNLCALVVILFSIGSVNGFFLVRRVERGADLILSIRAVGLRSLGQPGKRRVRSRGGALHVP